jgi:hypothetical protein
MGMSHGTVTTTRNGNIYTGHYMVTDGIICVSHPKLGDKKTQIGGSAESPQALASIMLRELIEDKERAEG